MSAEARARALRRADALARMGLANDARDCLLALVATSPSDWSVVQAAAELCARTGQTEHAIRLYLGMARQFARQGATARAGQVYEEVLRLAPGDRAAQFRGAELAAAAGDHERARALLAGAAPDDAQGGGNAPVLGVAARAADVTAYLSSGRFDDARRALVRLVTRARGVEAELTEAWLLAAGSAPGRVAPLAVALADVCLVAGDPDAAVRTLREFLTRAPGEPDALRHLVGVAVEAGAGAVALEAQAALVDALVRLGRHREALPVAEDLVARLPDAANRERVAQVTAALAATRSMEAADRTDGPNSATAAMPAAGAAPVTTGDDRMRDLSAALDALGAP